MSNVCPSGTSVRIERRSPGYAAPFSFRRDRLPHPVEYYAAVGLKLSGTGGWRDAICPFHEDSKPSLRVRFETGAFRCMACGAHGGDVLAFHMLRHRLRFIDAAKALGAWEVAR